MRIVNCVESVIPRLKQESLYTHQVSRCTQEETDYKRPDKPFLNIIDPGGMGVDTDVCEFYSPHAVCVDSDIRPSMPELLPSFLTSKSTIVIITMVLFI